jgi:hypothetical protein
MLAKINDMCENLVLVSSNKRKTSNLIIFI